ncbi:hypothetical protein FACS1894133_1360 [Clostridia bacterium]|nr:hypothetical protein FACS1894133_1360 [Clostridia bacterium]
MKRAKHKQGGALPQERSRNDTHDTGGNGNTERGGASDIARGSVFKAVYFTFAAIWIIAAVYVIGSLDSDNSAREQRISEKKAELSHLSMESLELKRYLTDEHLPEYMEQVARDELNYADPNERIYYIVNE